MSHEGFSHEVPSDIEKEGTLEKTIESLQGPLPELLRMHFDSLQLDILKRKVFDAYEIDLDTLSMVDQNALDIISCITKYFETEDEDEREVLAKDIVLELNK